MRMLRWVRDKTRKDGIRSEDIANYLEVAPIEDEIRKNYLRWFGYVCRRPKQAVVRRSIGVQTTTKRKRETKKTWLETVRNNLKICKLIEEIALDRMKWREERVHVADPI